jgi:hypothetical protein
MAAGAMSTLPAATNIPDVDRITIPVWPVMAVAPVNPKIDTLVSTAKRLV